MMEHDNGFMELSELPSGSFGNSQTSKAGSHGTDWQKFSSMLNVLDLMPILTSCYSSQAMMVGQILGLNDFVGQIHLWL